MSFALGIDTGGTCTDAVLVDAHGSVRASAKALTTHGRLIDGLAEAAAAVLRGHDANAITLVSLSTTLATNALVEDRGRPVGLVLIGHSPDRLKRARLDEALRGDPVRYIAGGHAADGTPVAPLDRQALLAAAHEMAPRVDAWAISSMFSVRNPEHELAAAELLSGVADLPISAGHQLSGALDAPRRALTALLNARLVPAIVELMDAATRMLDELGVDAPLMVVKGDGTLIDAALARQRPIETLLSGPAASVVGAAHLCGRLDDAVIIDIGGTTSDVARLVDGAPGLASDGARVGGWATRVEAIDIASIGLGGDSDVRLSGKQRIELGPARIAPLALTAQEDASVLASLHRQWERSQPMSHDGVLLQARPAGKRRPRSAAQRELLARIGPGTLPAATLFAGGTSLLALQRLEQQGFVQRCGFTPTDACHVLGTQSQWHAQAAWLGARLALRQVDAAAAADDASVVRFCQRVLDELSRRSAVAIAASALGLDGARAADDPARLRWLNEMVGREPLAGCRLQPELQVPIVGLGASAPHVHPAAARMLGTAVTLPEHGEVANAVGAVVGSVRQQAQLTLQPLDQRRVRALLPSGPQDFDSLDEALATVEPLVECTAREAAIEAGAGDVSVRLSRDEKRVTLEGLSVLVECTVRASAVGRPRAARPA